MKAALLSLCLFAALTLTVGAQAQTQPRIADGFSTDWAHLKLESRELAPHLYLLHASGGNTLALVGTEGTLLVDPAFPQVAPKLKQTLVELKAPAVRYIITTHYHSDHSGGNGAFVKDGAVVVGQDNCRARMLQTRYSAYWGYTSPPAPRADLPTLTFQRSLTLFFDEEEILSTHGTPSHTDGDTVVYFRKANVVHMGDIFVNNLYPYIDILAKGTINGYLPVIDEVLAKIDDRTQVIPGHGPVATKQELKAYRDMLQVVRDRVAAAIAAGKSLDQIIAMHPSREYDAKNATDRVNGDDFVVLVYQSLTGKEMGRHPLKK